MTLWRIRLAAYRTVRLRPNGTLVAMTHNDVDQTPGDLYYYYYFDGLGSVVATTDPSGNVVRRYEYEPYGKEISPSSSDYNPWRYASGYFDKQTGLLSCYGEHIRQQRGDCRLV